jgi:hypothetical protein
VAMPAASRCSERIASRVEEERIGIVEKTDEQLCATTSKYEEKRELGNSRSDSCQFMLVIHRRLTANRNYPFVRLFPLRPNHLPLLLLFADIHFPTSRSSADSRDLPQICSPGLSDVIGFKQYIIHRRQTDDEYRIVFQSNSRRRPSYDSMGVVTIRTPAVGAQPQGPVARWQLWPPHLPRPFSTPITVVVLGTH